jgi:hypothetical protein
MICNPMNSVNYCERALLRFGICTRKYGAYGGVVVEVLRYKPDGRGIDSYDCVRVLERVVNYVITDASLLLKKFGREERKEDTEKMCGYV